MEFKIGEMVAFKTGLAKSRAGHYPLPFLVIETLVQTSPGGEQVHYVLSGEERANEIELVAWDSEDVEAAITVAEKMYAKNVRKDWRTVKYTSQEEGGDAE